MSILIDQNTKAICQGFAGNKGTRVATAGDAARAIVAAMRGA